MLKDCSKALTINPKSPKAYYRSASALLALDRLDEALDCCDRCLTYDADNANVQDLRKKVSKLKDAKEKRQAERQTQIRKQQEKEMKLRLAFKVSVL